MTRLQYRILMASAVTVLIGGMAFLVANLIFVFRDDARNGLYFWFGLALVFIGLNLLSLARRRFRPKD